MTVRALGLLGRRESGWRRPMEWAHGRWDGLIFSVSYRKLFGSCPALLLSASFPGAMTTLMPCSESISIQRIYLVLSSCCPSRSPLCSKIPIVQAQKNNCYVYFKWKNMKLLNRPSNYSKRKRSLRTGEPGPRHSTLAWPPAGQACRGHLALKSPTRGPGQVVHR